MAQTWTSNISRSIRKSISCLSCTTIYMTEPSLCHSMPSVPSSVVEACSAVVARMIVVHGMRVVAMMMKSR